MFSLMSALVTKIVHLQEGHAADRRYAVEHRKPDGEGINDIHVGSPSFVMDQIR